MMTTPKQKQSEEHVKFRPRRLAHANLLVGDTDRAAEFYNKVCGFEIVRRGPVQKSTTLSNGNTHHDLGLPQVGVRGRGLKPGLNHLGWELENEVELIAAYERGKKAGLNMYCSDHIVCRGVYLRDPDGNMHEFYADMTKDWRETLATVDISPEWTPGNPPPTNERNYDPDPQIRRVEDALFHPRCITHAAIVTDNFEPMLEFFTETAGLDKLFRGPDDSYLVLGGTKSGWDLGLFRASAGRPLGLQHIGFVVDDEDDLRESVSRMRTVGVEPVIELDHATKRSVFIKSNDGMLLEFYSPRQAPLSSLRELDSGIALHLA
ncbi:MAG: dioxygenase [Acidobacteria bacterium]|nr:MAG: dioxygenase [Acidobacteriota bacterium]